MATKALSPFIISFRASHLNMSRFLELLVFTSRALFSQCIRNLLLLRPGNGGLPANTLPGRADLIVELINFFQGQPLSLINHGVNKGDAQEAAAEPDEENLGLQVRIAGSIVDKVRGGEAECPVEEPVGGSGHGQRLGSDLERKDFSSDDPGMVLVDD
jgi:hypothetical protein